jgi:pimeloyl-ACP methyl ester carboxylesterase
MLTSRPTGSAMPGLVLSKLSAAVAAIVGVVISAVGVGVAGRYLTKTGFTAISALGLAGLLTGLALLGLSWMVFWRASRGWQRLWFVPTVLIAVPCMFSIAVGAMLAYSPRTNLGVAKPDLNGMTFRDLSFRTADGVLLSAWYVESSNHAAVVTVPGSGSNRMATLGQATVLARHGYGVLMLDPRGQGHSGGAAMDAGWYGELDVSAAVEFLRQTPGVDPARIGVLGLSMGAEEAIGATAVQPRIRAVVAEGATHRTAQDKAGYLPGGLPGALQRGLDRLTYGTAALLSDAPYPRSLHNAIAVAHATEFLLIAAGNVADEPTAAAYLRGAAPDRVQIWTVPEASHVHALAQAPAEWTARVTGFFDRTLNVTG